MLMLMPGRGRLPTRRSTVRSRHRTIANRSRRRFAAPGGAAGSRPDADRHLLCEGRAAPQPAVPTASSVSSASSPAAQPAVLPPGANDSEPVARFGQKLRYVKAHGSRVFQMRSTRTRCACEANASRSLGSDVRTVPPGSADATTNASTAEPRRARRRRKAARRASDSLTSSRGRMS